MERERVEDFSLELSVVFVHALYVHIMYTISNRKLQATQKISRRAIGKARAWQATESAESNKGRKLMHSNRVVNNS